MGYKRDSIKFYNDYVSLTKRYLKNYKLFKVSIDNLTNDLNAIKAIIDNDSDLVAPIAHYGEKMPNASDGITQTEKAWERRQAMLINAQSLENNIRELTRIVAKIEKALEGLEEEDANIVREFYMEKFCWEEIGNDHGYSESWVRKRGNKAVANIALMLFGLKASPEHQTVVFAE